MSADRGHCASDGGPYAACHWTCQGRCTPVSPPRKFTRVGPPPAPPTLRELRELLEQARMLVQDAPMQPSPPLCRECPCVRGRRCVLDEALDGAR